MQKYGVIILETVGNVVVICNVLTRLFSKQNNK